MQAEHKALYDWYATEDGADINNFSTFHAKDEGDFDRRLRRAFFAGIDSGKKIAKDEIKNAFTEIIDKAV